MKKETNGKKLKAKSQSLKNGKGSRYVD